MSTDIAHSLIEKFPASLVEAARAVIAKAHTKLERAATKASVVAPPAPTLTVIKEYLATTSSTGEGGVETKRTFRAVDLEVAYARPALDGWEFLAVVEPMSNGNYLRAFPGATIAEGELDCFRLTRLTCDHCNTKRLRAETFIVRDANGEHKQVGSSCVEAFLGGKSAAAIIAALAWPKILAAVGEGEGGGGSERDLVLERADFMAQVASCVRNSGWLSAANARISGGQSTASLAWFILTPAAPFDCARQRAAREKNSVTDADRATGNEAIAWALALTGTSDYEQNLRIVMANGYDIEPGVRAHVVSRDHAGIVASAIAGYNRARGEEQAKKARSFAPSAHVGKLGDRIAATVVLEKLASFDSDYGPVVIHTFRDDIGNAFVWKTSRTVGAIGERVRLRGTVKKQDEYRGEKQTTLTRCTTFDDVSKVDAKSVTDDQIRAFRDDPKMSDETIATCDAALAADAKARAKCAKLINSRNGY